MMRKRLTSVLILLSAFLLLASAAGAMEEKRTTLEDQSRLAVTIYNEDLALVKDQRQVRLDSGLNRLAFREVSARIRPETALLRSLSHPEDFFLVEQNFDFDLLTPEKLLEKYVGKRVQVIQSHPQTGAETTLDAEVLAANGGVVLRIGDRIETGIPGRIVYPDVPENLRDRPTLVTLLNSGTEKPQQLELSYLTGGLSWQADYVAELAPGDDSLDLSGWVTLTNRSGATYEEATLQLVAGDVHRGQEAAADYRVMEMKTMARAEAPRMAEEALFEYHLYTLDRPTTIRENQTKQVSLLSASAIPVKKEFLLEGSEYYYQSRYGDLGEKLKVGVYVEFENREEAGLGMPLPRGIVRVYKRDSAGGAQFVGEDRIDHTPKNEDVRLKLGDAFDVTASKKQTAFEKKADYGPYEYVFESAYEITLKNAKEEAVTVKVLEPMPGDWKVLSESHPHAREASGTALWEVPVPAEGEAVLTYRVEVRF